MERNLKSQYFQLYVFEISIKDSLMSENNKLQKKFVQINISLLYL